MHYAKHNGVGTAKELPEGAIEITAQRYKELLALQASGMRVTVIDGEVVDYSPPVYRPDGTEAKEYTPGDPLITAAPPADLHVPEWQNDKWVEGETAEQKQAREDAEAQAERERLDNIRVTRFQAKAALLQAGLLDQVQVAVNDAEPFVQIAWADAVEFRRNSPTIAALAKSADMTDEQVDDLFRAAMKIRA